MDYSLRRIQEPTKEPVTLDEIKAHLGFLDVCNGESPDHLDTILDQQLTAMVTAARQYCEEFQNRSYMEQKWKLIYDTVPGFPIYLHRPP